MISCSEGTVRIEGDTLHITAELSEIIAAMLHNGIPEEAVTLALQLAKTEIMGVQN